MRAFITQRETTDEHGVSVDVLESNYVHYFEAFGLDLIPISNFSHVSAKRLAKTKVDLIILTGGGNLKRSVVIEAHKGEEQPHRDRLEEELLTYARLNNIPVLAICRGFQFMHHFLGGVVSRINNSVRTIGEEHLVSFGSNQRIWVNHFHHEGIYLKDLVEELNVISLDHENEIVEACYHPKYRWLAIQWHPERPIKHQPSREKVDAMIHTFLQQRGDLHESDYLGRRSGHTT